MKHWGDGTKRFLCGESFTIEFFSRETTKVDCINCLKMATNSEFRYSWIPEKIKTLEYNRDFDILTKGE